VVAHAYDIYQRPRNLTPKLRHAAFAAGVCEYSVATLRAVAGPDAAARIQVVKMGVDHDYFTRRAPQPAGRTVVAVGRLVEKKGFGYLLDAAARLDAEHGLEKLVIVGDGPLREKLHAQARSLGLQDLVEWTGPQSVEGVRNALERADVLAIPAVPAGDGDRDVLPLIAGEALAMEVCVVASDFVGLPELVRPPWGRLVAPRDADALAAAIAALLNLPSEERRAAGRAGREFVISTRDLRREAERVTQLITSSQLEEAAVPLAAADRSAQITGVR
jgi:glycosyltransferase involved in cell wall biosynthesis